MILCLSFSGHPRMFKIYCGLAPEPMALGTALSVNGTELWKQEYRDSLLLRYAISSGDNVWPKPSVRKHQARKEVVLVYSCPDR
jgi:hypothetical protein